MCLRYSPAQTVIPKGYWTAPGYIKVFLPARSFEGQQNIPAFLIACSDSNHPCIKYDDESSDLMINFMLTWYKRSFIIGQLEFEV